MSAGKHTPGPSPLPWAPEPKGYGVVDANGRTVARIPVLLGCPTAMAAAARAAEIEARIVQCVNAHDGLVDQLQAAAGALRCAYMLMHNDAEAKAKVLAHARAADTLVQGLRAAIAKATDKPDGGAA